MRDRAVPAFLRLRQLGGRRPGRQPVRDRPGHPGGGDDPGRPRAARAGERHDQDRPVADPARGDHAAVARGCAARWPPPRPRTRNCWPRSRPAPRRSRTGPTCCTPRSGCSATRVRHADLAYRGPAEFLADLRVVQESLAAAGAGRQAFGELQHLIWQAETFGFHLADLEVRQHSEVHARALRELRAAGAAGPGGAGGLVGADRGGAGHVPRRGLDPGPVRRRRVPPLRGQLHPLGRRHRRGLRAGPATRTDGGRVPVLDVVPLFESAADLANAPDVLTGMLALPEVARAARRQRAGASRRCSATPTRPRNSARPAPPCGCSTPRPGWPTGPRPTTCG